ncbi:MAG TPA: HD domain-containing protein, partial [Bdellovibrionota bacterium]|nr:HD domain-containing protein [Bdellovibrionota bacterium]
DLEGRILRAIGDPEKRFKEDALRLLRAVRFTANLGFHLDLATGTAVKNQARLIRKVSHERVRDELTLTLTGPRPAQALRLLSELGLLHHLLPEIEALADVPQPTQLDPTSNAWDTTLKVLQVLSDDRERIPEELGWAALLHGVGKPEAWKRSRQESLNGHEIVGADLAASICRQFKLSRAQTETVSQLVSEQLRFKDVFQMREATLVRWLQAEHFPLLLRLHRALSLATDGNLAPYEFCRTRFLQLGVSGPAQTPKLIDGNDLIQLGFQPGRQFSQILEAVEDLAIEGKLRTKESALEFVIRHFAK